jgi:hypothetical protein
LLGPIEMLFEDQARGIPTRVFIMGHRVTFIGVFHRDRDGDGPLRKYLMQEHGKNGSHNNEDCATKQWHG